MFFAESTRFPAFLSWTVSKRSDSKSNVTCKWLVVWASKSYKRLAGAYVQLNFHPYPVFFYRYFGGVYSLSKLINSHLGVVEFEDNVCVINADLPVISVFSLQQKGTIDQQLLCRTESVLLTTVRLQSEVRRFCLHFVILLSSNKFYKLTALHF